ncbi:MAG: efflux RND transporter periplasmic adaptor subunit [Bacteroidetes bacterium]|nr:efflux RND transporter periplasmic adaptor subunit [Bacteroidota bacterium]
MKQTLMLVGVLACLCQAACTSTEAEKIETPTFLVTSAVQMDTSVTKSYVSQVRSIRNIEIKAQEKGYLQDIYVDEGQYVHKGQLLFRIMPKIYEAELQKAQAEVNEADIEVQNSRRLADSNIVSKNELAMAMARYNRAKAELGLAQVHLGFTEIRAPFDGLVDRLHLKQGSLVGEGDLLTSLSDNSRMWVYFNVSEPEYLNYVSRPNSSEKTKVQLQMANGQLFDHPGVVETIEGEFNNENGNIAFRAAFPNEKGVLRHGETGNVLMRVPLKKAVVIPQKATLEIMDKKYVYVIDKDNIARLTPITIGAQLPDLYVVSEGLSGDEKILLEGLLKVKNNDHVVFRYQDPHSVIDRLKLPTE